MATIRKTLGDYLADEEPLVALWPDMVGIVFHDSPRQAYPERLGPAARTLWHVGNFEGEVINGGISTFFSNSAGNWSRETLIALRDVGAHLCFGLLGQALTLFPDGEAPTDRQRRCDHLFAFEERDPQFLEDLTQTFYEQVDALEAVPVEDLNALQLAFMEAHRDESVRIEPDSEPIK